MDGLLVDSEPYWKVAEIAAFKAVGIDLTEKLCGSTTGLRIDEVVDYWYERYPWEGVSKTEVIEDIMQRMEDLLRADSRPLPGVMDLLEQLRHRDVPVAIASSSYSRLIEVVVDGLGVRDLVSVICSAQDDAYGKPHPAVFIRAAKLLGANPSECLVFEDSYLGVIAAIAAKMQVVAVPEAHNFDDERYVIADAKLTSIEHFDLGAYL